MGLAINTFCPITQNARIYAVHLTTANQSEIRRAYLVSVIALYAVFCYITIFSFFLCFRCHRG